MTGTTTARSAGGLLPPFSPLALNALCATWILATCNTTSWGHLFRIFADNPLAAAVFAAAIWALILLVAVLLAVRQAQKPVLAFLPVLSRSPRSTWTGWA